MPDLKALESLIVAAETLNFSEAAARRHTVQSAISAHIHKLEVEAGRPLFERGRGQTMRLTAEGQTLVAYARRILNLTDEAMEAIRQAPSRRVVRLGTTATMALGILPRILQAVARDNPEIQVHVFCDRSNALLERLDSGEIELALMMDQGKRPGRCFVEQIPLAWAGGPLFRLDSRADVPLVFLTDGRDLRRHAFDALDRAGRAGHITQLSLDPIGIRAVVLADLALTVMPEPAITDPLKVLGPAEGLPMLGEVALSLYRHPGFAITEIVTLSEIIHAQITHQTR